MYTLFTHTHTHTHTHAQAHKHTHKHAGRRHTHTNKNARTLATELPLYINTTVLLAVSALASVLVYIAIYETKQLLHSFCSYFSGANHAMYINKLSLHMTINTVQ